MVLEVKRVPSKNLKNLQIAIEVLNKKVGKVGWFKGNKYPAEKMYNKEGVHIGHYFPVPVAEVAHTHEFGSKKQKIPERPFMRPTVEKNKSNWIQQSKSYSKKVINGSISAEDMLNIMGKQAVTQIKITIENIWSPPLKPVTIYARMSEYADNPELSEKTRIKRNAKLEKFVPTKFYKPLIDTRRMISTLINVVEDEK